MSLKYYGLCMRKGSYRVQLHFAEIMFSDDEKFSSLGKLIFDVLILVNEQLIPISRIHVLASLIIYYLSFENH